MRAILRRTQLPARLERDDPAEKASPAGLLPRAKFLLQPKKSSDKNGRGDRCLAVRGFILDTRTYELTTALQAKIRLTPVQFDLLYHLMSHPGEIFSPPRLLDEVWDYPTDAGSPDLVRVHVKNLRENRRGPARTAIHRNGSRVWVHHPGGD